jgi:hypothetical protein
VKYPLIDKILRASAFPDEPEAMAFLDELKKILPEDEAVKVMDLLDSKYAVVYVGDKCECEGKISAAVDGDRFDVEEAKKEVQEKTDELIEEETAYKWGARAVACFELYAETEIRNWLIRGYDNRHESIEHASFAGKAGEVLEYVIQRIGQVLPPEEGA